jgi:CheY-like chemotaxis protein
MPNGGVLTIETANMRFDEAHPGTPGAVAPGDYVALSVTDTGEGMAPEVIERATEPFFTTKPLGKGTGLGLSMIYGFAKQSGGHLSIYSEVGVGTTVRLYLPAARDLDASDEPDAPDGQKLVRGGESILVVDDNHELRQIAMRRLTHLGYKCREAENGPTALTLLDSGERFDLLFTDIGLPDSILGYELAEMARQRQPWLKVLFTTGYAKVQTANGEDQADTAPMLRKPYRNQQLAEMVRMVLGPAS